jgi:hypothetical protein
VFFVLFFIHECELTPLSRTGWFITSSLHLAALFFRFFTVTKCRIMTSYLLLRNNKESGPHTLEELVSQGLKPYDLVWVNGKSAAWRYPGEITELMQYAPMVEEQPFDRFYKKNTEEKPTELTKPSQEQTPQQKETPAQPAYVPKKSVFVTMPGGKQSSVGSGQKELAVGNGQSAVEQSQPKKQQEPVPDQYAQYQQYQPPVNDASHLTQTITIKENPVAAEVKYSQSLDDIKQMYVRTLQERKQRMINKSSLLRLGKNAAIILAIAGAGVIIGFSLKKRSGKEDFVSNAASVQQQAIANPPAVDSTTGPTTLQSPSLQEAKPDMRNEEPVQKKYEETLLQRQEEKAEPPVIEQKQEEPESNQPTAKSTMKKEPVVEKKREPIIDPTYPGADTDPRTGERTRKVREAGTGNEVTSSGTAAETNNTPPATAKEQPKATMKKSGAPLSKLVSVSSNDYQIVAFGGIRNLHLTVTNTSKYILDNVVVELNYLKPSEQPLKTQNIEFRSVAPGGTLTIRVPDTNRGVKISYRILNILSVQSQKEMADL